MDDDGELILELKSDDVEDVLITPRKIENTAGSQNSAEAKKISPLKNSLI